MATAVSANTERHVSALIVALEFYPQMAIQIIHKCSPNMVFTMVQNDPNNKFMKSLNKAEKILIQTLDTDGYKKLDMSLLYKLIRRFNLVAEPSKKWGNRPLATNINQGDDMERMRNNRNDLVHRPKGGLSEEERETFFKESIEIACRVDIFIGDSTSRFETGIRNAKIYRITQEQYKQALEKCVELQQQLDISGINHVDLYYGDDIAVKLGHQDLPASDSTGCVIYIRDLNMNVPAIVEKLEQAKKRLNEGFYQIKLLEAESGSLVLHVEINNLCFMTKDSLHKAIEEFLHRVFKITSISGNLDQHVIKVVLAECDSYIISEDKEENDEYLKDQEPSVLKLDVMVRNTALQSKTDLYRDVHGFISKVLNVTDKDVESTNGSPIVLIMANQHVDAQPSSQVEPVSVTSTMGFKKRPPTIFQHDQSAKNKPEKSNNENEGNVSTIPQESYESVGGSSRVVSERLPPLTSQQDHSAKKMPKKSNNVNENEENVFTIPQESHKNGTAIQHIYQQSRLSGMD